MVVAVAVGTVAAAALAVAVTAVRRPRIRRSLERLAAWTLRHWSRIFAPTSRGSRPSRPGLG
jgi:hypothetical protein